VVPVVGDVQSEFPGGGIFSDTYLERHLHLLIPHQIHYVHARAGKPRMRHTNQGDGALKMLGNKIAGHLSGLTWEDRHELERTLHVVTTSLVKGAAHLPGDDVLGTPGALRGDHLKDRFAPP
jgi:hypothetical protein